MLKEWLKFVICVQMSDKGQTKNHSSESTPVRRFERNPAAWHRETACFASLPAPRSTKLPRPSSLDEAPEKKPSREAPSLSFFAVPSPDPHNYLISAPCYCNTVNIKTICIWRADTTPMAVVGWAADTRHRCLPVRIHPVRRRPRSDTRRSPRFSLV